MDETKQVVLPVAGVIENYVYHYAYMTAETYERLFGTDCEFKTAYMTTDADPYALGAAVAEHSRVANVTVVASMRSLVKNMMKSMAIDLFHRFERFCHMHAVDLAAQEQAHNNA